MKQKTKSFAIASVVTYVTVQVSGLVLAVFKSGYSSASDVITLLAIGFAVTVIPTLIFAVLLGGCARLILRGGASYWAFYPTATVLALLIWVTVNTMLLKQSLMGAFEDIKFALTLCVLPALLGAASMQWTLLIRIRKEY